jgi:hypothetical protein
VTRRVYEGRYVGAGRWEVRRRARWVSGPVRAAGGVAVAAGAAARVWQRLDAQAHAVVVLVAVAVVWVAWRARGRR